MKTFLPAAAIVLGMVLLAGSAVWAIVFPASRGWTEEKSLRMTDLGNQATAISLKLGNSKSRPSMHAGENPAELKEQYDKISAEYKALHQEFVGASDSPKTAAKILRWSGIAFVAAGAFVVMASRNG